MECLRVKRNVNIWRGYFFKYQIQSYILQNSITRWSNYLRIFEIRSFKFSPKKKMRSCTLREFEHHLLSKFKQWLDPGNNFKPGEKLHEVFQIIILWKYAFGIIYWSSLSIENTYIIVNGQIYVRLKSWKNMYSEMTNALRKFFQSTLCTDSAINWHSDNEIIGNRWQLFHQFLNMSGNESKY